MCATGRNFFSNCCLQKAWREDDCILLDGTTQPIEVSLAPQVPGAFCIPVRKRRIVAHHLHSHSLWSPPYHEGERGGGCDCVTTSRFFSEDSLQRIASTHGQPSLTFRSQSRSSASSRTPGCSARCPRASFLGSMRQAPWPFAAGTPCSLSRLRTPWRPPNWPLKGSLWSQRPEGKVGTVQQGLMAEQDELPRDPLLPP